MENSRGSKVNNEQLAPCLFISVESRKGGVGKTTAALCLARILKRRGYAVLVLDLDITGTDAAYIAEAPFWAKDLHIIQEIGEGEAVPISANLIKMFDKYFMSGSRLPEFSVTPHVPYTLLVDLERVNVFGSQIYNTDIAGERDKLNGVTCIERPSILFDEFAYIVVARVY